MHTARRSTHTALTTNAHPQNTLNTAPTSQRRHGLSRRDIQRQVVQGGQQRARRAEHQRPMVRETERETPKLLRGACAPALGTPPPPHAPHRPKAPFTLGRSTFTSFSGMSCPRAASHAARHTHTHTPFYSPKPPGRAARATGSDSVIAPAASTNALRTYMKQSTATRPRKLVFLCACVCHPGGGVGKGARAHSAAVRARSPSGGLTADGARRRRVGTPHSRAPRPTHM